MNPFRRHRPAPSRLEHLIRAVAASPWSSVAWVLYSLAWTLSELYRGKSPGWDGVGQMVGTLVSLAIIRRWALS